MENPWDWEDGSGQVRWVDGKPERSTWSGNQVGRQKDILDRSLPMRQMRI